MTQAAAVDRFRELHRAGCFVLPNPWDAGTAKVGSGLLRVAWGAFLRAARELHAAGTFGAFAGGATFAELNAMFTRRGD